MNESLFKTHAPMLLLFLSVCLQVSNYTPTKRMLSRVFWSQPVCPSVCLFICVSVFVQNTTSCQSAGGGIKSHSVTALVSLALLSSLLLWQWFKTFQHASMTLSDSFPFFARGPAWLSGKVFDL